MGNLKRCFTVLIFAELLASPLQARQLTIPEAVARGSVGSVAAVPSGQLIRVDELLRATDMIVIGTVGELRAHLSDDEREILTDLPLVDAQVLYRSPTLRAAAPARNATVIATQAGGTALVGSILFTQKEPALPLLRPGTRALFLLTRSGDKLMITGRYFGAFAIVDDRLTPLMSRDEFAPDFRGLQLSDAVERMTKIRQAQEAANER